MRAPVDWRDTGREPREEWRARLPAGCTCRNCGRPWDAKQKRANYWMWVIGEEATCDGNPSRPVKHLLSRRKLTRFDRRVVTC